MAVDTLRHRYETAVLELRAQSTAMRGAGLSLEAVARAMHAERRRLTAAFKALTPEPWRSLIDARTLAAYGDPVGPTIDALRGQGKTWEDIIESAMRPGSPPAFDGAHPRDDRLQCAGDVA